MTDTIDWDGQVLPLRHFTHDDPRLLGATLQGGAEILHQRRIVRAAVHEISENRFLTISGGKPFRVDTYELRDDVGKPLNNPALFETRMNPVFTAEDTGDGITFTFHKDVDQRPLTKLVTAAARESARRNNP